MKRVSLCLVSALMALAIFNFVPNPVASIQAARAGEVVDVAPEVAAESAAADAAAASEAAATARAATAEAEQEAATAARQAASEASQTATRSAAAATAGSRTLRPVYGQNHFLLYYVLFVHARANGDRYKCKVSVNHKVKSCTNVSNSGSGNLPTFVWIILGGIIASITLVGLIGIHGRHRGSFYY